MTEGHGASPCVLNEYAEENYNVQCLSLTAITTAKGVQYFPWGPTFPGGYNCLFPIETHISCDFPGGSGPDCPPSESALGLLGSKQEECQN